LDTKLTFAAKSCFTQCQEHLLSSDLLLLGKILSCGICPSSLLKVIREWLRSRCK